MINSHYYIRRVFNREQKEADSACLLLRELLSNRLVSKDRFAMELLAREAINNAMKHGLEKITFKFFLGKHRAWLRVTDGGSGFEWAKVLSQSIDDASDSGRGLAIYAVYAQKVLFNQRGNDVLLVRKLQEVNMNPANIAFDGKRALMHPGDLTVSTVEQVRGVLKNLIDDGVKDVTLDLAGVQMIDSSGIGLLIQVHNSLTKAGGVLCICNASSELKDLFISMRLDKHFSIL